MEQDALGHLLICQPVDARRVPEPGVRREVGQFVDVNHVWDTVLEAYVHPAKVAQAYCAKRIPGNLADHPFFLMSQGSRDARGDILEIR